MEYKQNRFRSRIVLASTPIGQISFLINHLQKRNLVFGLPDRAYKIASRYTATHCEFMKIKCADQKRKSQSILGSLYLEIS